MRSLRNEIIPILSETMLRLEIGEPDWLDLIGNATDLSHGDIALPCHSLSRILRKSPNDIADQITLNLSSEISGIASVSSINGFVNFKANSIGLSNQVASINSQSNLGVKLEN